MKEKKKRLFFALCPDDQTRRALSKLQQNLELNRGRRVDVADLHITLQYLGSSTAEQEACITEAAGKIDSHPFTIQVSHLDYWPRPKIVWAGIGRIPAPLSDLVMQLKDQLELCGFMSEQREYNPHVTLFRKAPQQEKQILPAPITWQVREFSLLASYPDGAPPFYQPIAHWALKK